jgi:tetratricopeptide (TPR) repeat protein
LRLPGLVTLVWAEGFSAVQATLDGMLAEAERSGSARGLHITYVILGLLKLQLGALPEADAAARAALRILQAADFSQGLPLVATVIADVAVEAGDLAEAEAALTMLPSAGLPPTQPAALIAATRGRLRMAQGFPAEALTEFDTCRSLISPGLWGTEIRDSGFLRSGSAQALLRMGEQERALELADAELADARAFSAPRALGIALRVAGLARGGERGLELLDESVAVLRSSPAVLQRAHSLAELGAALRRSGRRAAAREPLAEALELAARCGAARSRAGLARS